MNNIRNIQAKTLLATTGCPDAWFGVRYNMNIYRGCEHRCIYCDSRSECYQIDNFDSELLVKANALELLERELSKKRIKGVVGTGSMTDPYTPSEKELDLTGQALKIIHRFGFGIHITTKSDLILKDLETMEKLSRTHASVSFTVTTTDDDLARQIEPCAPPPSARLRAMKTLSEHGIITGITMMPILPFITDTEDNIKSIVAQAAANGASYIFPGFGVTLRNRQREYYYAELNRLFPGLSQRYDRVFKDGYGCSSPNANNLYRTFKDICTRYGIKTDMKEIAPAKPAAQMKLF